MKNNFRALSSLFSGRATSKRILACLPALVFPLFLLWGFGGRGWEARV